MDSSYLLLGILLGIIVISTAFAFLPGIALGVLGLAVAAALQKWAQSC